MYQIGNRSLLFVCVTLGFIGMVLVFQTCLQVNRVTGDLSQVGAEFLKLLVRDFGPSLTALMLATRVGAGIAAEIGSMVVTEQIDALRMSGVDPIDYLIVPRFLASLVMTGVLTMLGVAVALGTGALTAYFSFDVNPRRLPRSVARARRRPASPASSSASPTARPSRSSPASAACARAAAPRASAGRRRARSSALASSVIVLDFFISGVGAVHVAASVAVDRRFAASQKAFGGKPVLRGIDLAVAARRGASSSSAPRASARPCPSSTSSACLRPDAGEIWLDGERVDRLAERALYAVRKRCAMVFQHSTLFDSMTLAENVALPLRKHRGLARDAAPSARRAPPRRRSTCTSSPTATPPSSATACASASPSPARSPLDPEYVLFDEPTTGLDPVSARRVDKLIRELADKLGVTAIVVSHDLTSIFAIADRIAILYQGVVHARRHARRAPRVDRSDRPAVHPRPQRRPDGDARVLDSMTVGRPMKSTKSLEFKVGALIVISLALLGGFLVAARQLLASAAATASASTSTSPATCSRARRSRSRGIKVGKVEEVHFLGGELDPDSRQARAGARRRLRRGSRQGGDPQERRVLRQHPGRARRAVPRDPAGLVGPAAARPDALGRAASIRRAPI